MLKSRKLNDRFPGRYLDFLCRLEAIIPVVSGTRKGRGLVIQPASTTGFFLWEGQTMEKMETTVLSDLNGVYDSLRQVTHEMETVIFAADYLEQNGMCFILQRLKDTILEQNEAIRQAVKEIRQAEGSKIQGLFREAFSVPKAKTDA